MKNQIQLTRRMFSGSLLLILVLIPACNQAKLEEMVAMTLTAIPPQPSSTYTATSEPSATPTMTQPPPPTDSPTPSPSATDTPEPPCFRLLNPPDGANLPSVGKLYFEWKPLDGAVKYLLEINAPGYRKQTFETEDTSVLRWLNTLPWEGAYSWQVTALDASGGVMCVVGPLSFSKPKFVPTSTPKREPAFQATRETMPAPECTP